MWFIKPTVYIAVLALIAIFACGIGLVVLYIQLTQGKITSDQILQWAFNVQDELYKYSDWIYFAIGSWYAPFFGGASWRLTKRVASKFNYLLEQKMKKVAAVTKEEGPPPADLEGMLKSVLTKMAGDKGTITITVLPTEVKKA
jgi:hypothetical protein